LRDNTEWTETVDIGANRIAGTDSKSVITAFEAALESKTAWENPFQGRGASRRIINTVTEE
jgi:UDP-N-acetylglucosamine 2-epimerase